jgi:putative acetyltransferase
VGPLEIAPGDGRTDDVRAMVQRHLDFARAHTPSEFVFAVEAGDLADDPDVTLLCGRRDDRLLAIGALRELDPEWGELKSMHTAQEVRGQGIGMAMLAQLVVLARQRGYRRVSLETGRSEAFAPARALYASAGFAECGPFGDYPTGGQSCFMTMVLD